MHEPRADPLVDLATSPVEMIAVVSPDGIETTAALRRATADVAARPIVMLHGGLDPLPAETLAAIATRSFAANAFLRAGRDVVVPTRRPRPDGARPAGAVNDTRAIIDAARRRLGAEDLVLFGSSGGGDLALEVAGDVGPVAILIEEPATSLLTGILEIETPRRGGRWAPDEVWPADYARHYTAARRRTTRAVLSRIACAVFVAQGDQPVDGVDPRRGLETVLVPELEALGKRVERRRYPGQSHGFALLTGVAPGAVARDAAEATARFVEDAQRFIARTSTR